MPGNLCTTAIVLAAAGLGLVTFTVATPTDPRVDPTRPAVNAVNGVVIDGYDPVAYFVDGEPVKGSPCLEVDHQGVAYRFSTPENRDRFQEDPTAFAPQLGGYSVFGMARGKRYDVDPKSWDIIDGKLYLSRNKKVRTLWQVNPTGYLNSAEANWRDVHEQ